MSQSNTADKTPATPTSGQTPDLFGDAEPVESVVDRRLPLERRKRSSAEAGYTGLERRRGPGRRRNDERRSAEEGEMTTEQFEFVMAIEMYKKVNKRMFPTWTEVLEVVQQLGYRKVQARDIQLENVPEPTIEKKAAKVA